MENQDTVTGQKIWWTDSKLLETPEKANSQESDLYEYEGKSGEPQPIRRIRPQIAEKR